MSLRGALVAQFHQPVGALGHLAAWIMSHRASNVQRSLWTVDQLALAERDDVLEIGFGPGLAIERAASITRGRVVGVDHSELMCRAARKRNGDAVRAGRVQLHCAEVDALPDLGGPFDAILAVNCMLFWPDPVAALAALRALARPGGRIAITHQPRNPRPTLADVERAERAVVDALARAGFVEPRPQRLALEPVPASCVIARNPG